MTGNDKDSLSSESPCSLKLEKHQARYIFFSYFDARIGRDEPKLHRSFNSAKAEVSLFINARLFIGVFVRRNCSYWNVRDFANHIDLYILNKNNNFQQKGLFSVRMYLAVDGLLVHTESGSFLIAID